MLHIEFHIQLFLISDCYDIYQQGKRRNQVYKIKPYGQNSMVEVFCDMKNEGWTIIQKRQDGTTNFFREWDDYKQGFGGKFHIRWTIVP